ncbi:hypothetical protein ACQEV4_02610 [Streptomyces shenzhenensis]|uniref:hypothetical protein n=1 Tax=Streptomyces shenzhenensis TaxID=943815 RepID=UPI003D916751
MPAPRHTPAGHTRGSFMTPPVTSPDVPDTPDIDWHLAAAPYDPHGRRQSPADLMDAPGTHPRPRRTRPVATRGSFMTPPGSPDIDRTPGRRTPAGRTRGPFVTP